MRLNAVISPEDAQLSRELDEVLASAQSAEEQRIRQLAGPTKARSRKGKKKSKASSHKGGQQVSSNADASAQADDVLPEADVSHAAAQETPTPQLTVFHAIAVLRQSEKRILRNQLELYSALLEDVMRQQAAHADDSPSGESNDAQALDALE